MPFTAFACAEAIHALDTLKADGIVLLGSAEGYFLGDERFDDLMAVLNDRAAVVFLHPNLHPTTDTLRLKTPGFIVEFLCDTTRAAVNLILSGTLERFPRIRWILAHAGGFLPYIAWRVSLANAMPETNANIPQGVLTYMSRFYFDTALSPSPYAMAALQALVEPSHILFGSDFPFAPAILAALQCKTLDEAAFFNADAKAAVMRGNALRLFPRLASQDETVIPAPVYRSQPLAKRIRRRLARPALAMVERMRNR
jgi:predicted TIM-barrel fold metal-dependent hydrolase